MSEDTKTEAHDNADVKISLADYNKAIGKGFIRSEHQIMSSKNRRRPIGEATGMEGRGHQPKARSTGGSMDHMVSIRNLHSRGPSVDLSSQLTSRRMYGNTVTRATTMTWNEEDLEKLQNEFPVLPYYKDESKTTIAIPPSLQVKESVWTLRYHSTKEVNDPSVNTDDQCPQKLEKIFVQQRFYKSRRLVRICIIILIIFILFSAATDECKFTTEIFNEVTAYSLCIDEEWRRSWRNIIFCAIQCPILLLWLLATFSKFYEENLTWLPSIFVFTIGGFMLASTVIGETPDSAIYMCYLFMVWLFIRIPFWSACLVTSIMFIIFVAVMLPLNVYDSKPTDDSEQAESPSLSPSWDEMLNSEQTSNFWQIELVEILYLFTTNICLMYAAHFWERSDRVEFLESKILNHVKGNSKNLINQILPIAVQERIQKAFLTTGHDDQKPIADEANDVSVLFSDIKGFTKFCSGVKAVDVVRALNTLYMTFDDSLVKLDVFKVETIGDAYFVSANCPIEAPDHARRLVILGKEMIKACAEFTPCGAKSKEYKFQMRIGVHSGKVCAGIVGRKMPRYHLFGQTVTIAECMESSGVPGKVQISEDTLTYLRDWENETGEKLDFSFESRGEREVIPSKSMTTYLVEFTQTEVV